MDKKKIIQLTNTIGIVTIFVLFYWIIIWSVNEIFGLRVFRETISDIFGFSISGILALLAGTLVINVMFNLSLIAENTSKKTSDELQQKSNIFVWLTVFFAILAISIASLFLGNYGTAKQRENELRNSAKSLIQEHSVIADRFLNYQFTHSGLKEISGAFTLIEKLDPNIKSITFLTPDVIDTIPVYLGIRYYYGNNEQNLKKADYIATLTPDEREYLDKVFQQNYSGNYFRAKQGSYLLYIPYEKNGKKIVFAFSNYSGYGVYGKTAFNSAEMIN